ncbi:hypothetical protein JX266_010002 [Neoarthrinium moseri]|nr:hypothetical protein JX266_010002 [Neoarthrinium moseri]
MGLFSLSTLLLAVVSVLAIRRLTLGSRKTARVPGLGYRHYPVLGSWRGAVEFMLRPRQCLEKGYRKYRKSYFKIATLREEYVLVSDRHKISEYLAASEDVLNFMDVGADRTTDSPNGNNEEYLNNAMSFTNAVVVSAEMIRLLPVWLKPYAVRFTPCWRKRKLTEDLMKDEVLQRLQLSHKVKGKPNDLLQWIVDASPVKERTVKNIVERIMGLNVAAIHTTTSVRLYIRSSMSLTDSAVQSLVSALALLAADSERYIPPMREEIAMNSEKGHITPRTMAGATKLDSFLRESGRVNLNSMIGLMRTARRDFHFKDGTLIPAGTRIGVPTISIHHDSTLYSQPQNVDCFRFVGASGGLADTNRFHPARTGLDYLTFGHGKNACPGRFFAVNLMKLVLAEMIVRYDMKLAPGTRVQKRYFGKYMIPNYGLRIMVRERGS